MDRWIPVTERLPERFGDYLVTTRNGFVMVAKWSYGLYKSSGEWNGHLRNCIVAWMPLPMPYQKGIKE